MFLEGFCSLTKRSVRDAADDGDEGNPLRLSCLISRTLVEGAFGCVVELLDVD